jgi:ATP-dependent helicase/nuclease subunit A
MVAGLAGGTGRQSQVLWTDEGPEIRFRAGKLETRGWRDAVVADKEAARREGIRLLYVAATRAMDHLVLGCYHAPPVSPTSQRSSAQQLWDLLSEGGLARIESGIGQPLAALEQPAGSAPTLPTRAGFAADRQTLLDAVCRRVATSPTSLAVQSPAAAVVLTDETAVEPDKADEEEASEPTEASPTPAAVRRSSSQGAAIGTATHRVLELVNLKNPQVDEVQSLARLACAEQEIPELQANIEGRVWSALHDDALQSIIDPDARTLSEVYVVVQDGEHFLEGYIDLLVDSGPEVLAILDYKTDKASSDAEIEAKKVRYTPQLAAYARAVEQITGRTPSSTDLVFARPGGRPTRSTPEEPGT